MYTTNAFLWDTWNELRRLSFRERIIHATIWLAGLCIVNIPALDLTFGVFHGNDGSLLVPSLFGAALNALLLYGNSALIRRWWRADRYLFWRTSLGLFLVVALLETLLDSGFFRLFYGTFNGELLVEIGNGTLLMNAFFFYAPSFVYGITRLGEPLSVAPPPTPRLRIRNGTEDVFLAPMDLFFVQSDGNYAIYHTRSGKVLERKSLKQIATELPPEFVRCHRSFIVNTQLIEKRSAQVVTIAGREVPIGRKYGGDFDW